MPVYDTGKKQENFFMAEKTVKKSSELAGNEKKVAYKVALLPQDLNRVSFTWNVFTLKMSPIMMINMLMLIGFAPLIAILYTRYSQVLSLGANGSFGANVGIGYPAIFDKIGEAEAIIMSVDVKFFAVAILSSLFIALSIAAGMYTARKSLRSDEMFRFRDLLIGIKEGYLPCLIASAFVMVFLFGGVCLWDQAALAMALGGNAMLWVIVRILVILVLIAVIVIAFWYMAIATNYDLSFVDALKHTGYYITRAGWQSALVLAIGVSPTIFILLDNLLGGSLFTMLVVMAAFMVLFEAELLIWSSFTDWAFDTSTGFLKTQAMAQNKAEATQKAQSAKDVSEEEKRNMLLVSAKSAYLSRAIPTVDEGTKAHVAKSLTMEEIQNVANTRKMIAEECADYAKQHETEEQYVAYNRMFEDRDKALTDTDKKGKKKKFSPKMLNQN